MDDFGKRLRDKLASSAGNRLKIALDGASKWIEEDLMPAFEQSLEKLAESGRERMVFRHKYVNDFRPEVADIEKLPAYQFFKARCDYLGLEHVVMSHKALGKRDHTEYPCLEILVAIPTRWKETEGGGLADRL